METVEEIEKRRADRQADLAKKQTEQYAVDLAARDALEQEHGDGAVTAVKVAKFKPGFPERVIVKVPTSAQYKRYVDQVGKAGGAKDPAKTRKASELLAESCWIYPREADDRKAMLEEFPGLLTTVAIAAAALAEGKAEDEGKG